MITRRNFIKRTNKIVTDINRFESEVKFKYLGVISNDRIEDAIDVTIKMVNTCPKGFIGQVDVYSQNIDKETLRKINLPAVLYGRETLKDERKLREFENKFCESYLEQREMKLYENG